MSYTHRLKQALSGPKTILHKFLTHYDPNSERIYAFVEGDADETFYRGQIQRFISDESLIHTYNCEGKAKVINAYRDIVAKYPDCQRVLFFLDKDVDELIGVKWPSDPRIFVTECYSIENYIVSRQALSRYLKDYVTIKKVDLQIDDILDQFEADLADFHKLMLPIMAWIVAMRRSGSRVILQDVDLGELCAVMETGKCKKATRTRISYLLKVTQANLPSPVWTEFRAACTELKRLTPKVYVRGRFEAWWLVQFCRIILVGLQQVVKEGNGSIRIHAQLHANTFIQLLGATIETPAPLSTFLSFHTKRASTQIAVDSVSSETAGFLAKIANLFKG